MIIMFLDNEFKIDSAVHIYARVSSEDQQERETIENQIDFAKKYCDLHKLDIVDIYKDDGISGKIPLENRPEGQRLVKDASDGKVKVVLIYNIKRLGRSARDILNSVYQLEQYGVKIRSMTEPFDTGNPHGRFILTVLAGVAELDRETTLETMWLGANRAARKGKWLGGIVPYGYFVNSEGYIEPCEDPLPGKEEMTEAGVIRLMYELVANQKWSATKVANYFNSLGIPPAYVKDGRTVKRGKRKVRTAGIWTASRIYNMLVNTTYKGIHVYGKRTKKDRELINRTVPAIVSEEEWERAQQVLRENRIEAACRVHHPYLLRGLIKCGICGLTYHGTAYAGPKRKLKPYYVCGGKVVHRGPFLGRCPSRNVPAEWLEQIVWNECVSFIQNPGEMINELAGSMNDQKARRNSLEEEIKLIKQELERKDLERHDIITLFRKRIITASDVEKQLQVMMNERASLQKRLRQLEEQLSNESNLIQHYTHAQKLLNDLREKIKGDIPFELKKEIVKTLVKVIIVKNAVPTDPEDKIKRKPPVVVEVHYGFTNAKELSLTDKGSSSPPTGSGRGNGIPFLPGQW